MAPKKKTKIRYVDVNVKDGTFVSKLTGGNKSHNFSDIKMLRSLLSNEKARILHVLKSENVVSIYGLAKVLGRDFKSVREDIKALERFGLIEFHAEKVGKRKSLKPILSTDKLQIIVNI
jgi:predicted transcriptional regulator